jgi:hypothetical protein
MFASGRMQGIIARYPQFLTGTIVNWLRNFENSFVLKIAFVCDKDCCSEDYAECYSENNGVEIAECYRFSTTVYSIRTHISTSYVRIRHFSVCIFPAGILRGPLQISGYYIPGFWLLSFSCKLYCANGLFRIGVYDENIANKGISTRNVESHPFTDSVRRSD